MMIPTHPMHPDFKRLASLRKFMMRGDPRTADNFGRDLAKTWIARHSPPLPDTSEVKAMADGAGHLITPGPNPSDTVMIYIHGGGLVYYDTRVFAPFLAGLGAELGVEIVALDYPKAPAVSVNVIFQTLHDRVKKVLAERPQSHVIIAGDSVGGLLALGLCQTLKSHKIKQLHLIYPVVDDSIDADCAYGQDHFLDGEMMTWFYDFIMPLFAQTGVPCQWTQENLRDLPPTTVHVAQTDVLAEQGTRFADLLQTAGRLESCTIHDGLPHDFCLYAGSSPAAQTAVQTIAKHMRCPVDA